MPWFFFERMAALIPGDNLCFADLNFVQLRGENHQGILDGGQRWVDVGGGDNATQRLFWTSKRSFWAPAPPANLGRVRRWSDLYSQNELREQPLYAEFFGPLGVKHFMSIGFPAPPGHTRNLLFFRNSGRDFTDRDKLLLQLLRPHLYELDLDAERHRQGVPRLTPREWQVPSGSLHRAMAMQTSRGCCSRRSVPSESTWSTSSIRPVCAPEQLPLRG